MPQRVWVSILMAAMSAVVQGQTMDAKSFEKLASEHPAGQVLGRLFPDASAKVPDGFVASGMTRKDYLPLIAGNVDYWKHFQSSEGAIVDPYERDEKHPQGKERQYSTPAFALASALLVKEAARTDLLDHATRAMSFATAALANHTTADFHADFYIPMLMHARRILRDRVDKDLAATWDEQFKSIVPEKIYHDVKAGGNWNLVQASGEFMRRKDGLVAGDQLENQAAYLEKCLKIQEARFTKLGMYADPNMPLAYDAFPRLWLEDALADGAILPPARGQMLENWLSKGALSGLLLLSPSGEWACGGRSAHHQWNEAENAEIAEINAVRWMKRGRPDIAGAFKRAAHLALTSMKRWQRPTGEMWIVKNFADPARRHGFEGYSFNSQYNLLAMGMLAIAHERADDSIPERPIPSESDSYVFDLRDPFHHVVAAAAGYYVLVDTSVDPHYGGTGLQRVHRSGVELSPITDSAGMSGFGPADAKVREMLAPGIQWRQSANGKWRSLAQFGVAHVEGKALKAGEKPKEPPADVVEAAELKVNEEGGSRAAFTIAYKLRGEGANAVVEEYVVSAAGVEGTSRIASQSAAETRIAFPALVSDGARPTDITIDGATLRIARKGAVVNEKKWDAKPGGVMIWEVVSPQGVKLELDGPAVATHNGYVRIVVGRLAEGTNAVTWKLRLEPAAK